MAKRRIFVDGSALGADVLFSDLVECKRDGSIIRIRSRSGQFERTGAMTEGYARVKVKALLKLLAEIDAERDASKVVRLGKR